MRQRHLLFNVSAVQSERELGVRNVPCLAAPKFTLTPRSAVARETEDMVFECAAEGNPPPTITWMRNGETLSSSEYFQVGKLND